jgi:hypothetical protein
MVYPDILGFGRNSPAINNSIPEYRPSLSQVSDKDNCTIQKHIIMKPTIN